MHLNDEVSSSGKDTVNLFGSFLLIVFSKNVHCSPHFRYFSEISSTPRFFAFGSDGVPPFILHHCTYILSYPLFRLFRFSLNSGLLPNLWSFSYIYPIHKQVIEVMLKITGVYVNHLQSQNPSQTYIHPIN